MAATNSAEAVWFNPAGNARLATWQGGTTHGVLHPGLDDLLSVHGLTLAGPLEQGTLQMGLSFLSADGWQEDVIALGFSRVLHPRAALGARLRSSAWSADDLSRRVWALDLGGTYEVGYVHPQVYLRLAWLLTDTNGANLSSGGQAAGQIPRGFTIAAALKIAQRELLLDVERRDGQTELRAGYETSVLSLAGATFRGGGVFVTDAVEEVDVGLGQDWREWHFDYAYTYPLRLSALGGMHRFSLKYQWR